MSLRPGEIIEKYVVEDVIGQGAMATVYRVRHAQLRSLHALKVLHVHNDSVKNRMIQEGMVQSGLRHPNIVAVTDIVEVNNAPGLVMELVEGPTLDRWLQDHRPTLDEAEALFLGILAGMEKAHADGMIHRDLKPANILLAPVDGRWVPKIADFGLAKAQGRLVDYKATMTGVMMGTPAYMAPEQIKNAAGVDHRADIFSLGCLLYELVVGVVPFEHEDWVDVLAAIRKGEYTPAKEVNPAIPERISKAIDACLVVDFLQRVQTVPELRVILLGEHAHRTYTPMVSIMPERPMSPVQPEQPPTPPPVAPPPSVADSIKRGLARGLIIGGVILLVTLLVVVLGNPRYTNKPPTPTPDQIEAAKLTKERLEAEQAALEKQKKEEEERRIAEEKAKAEAKAREEAAPPPTNPTTPKNVRPPKDPVNTPPVNTPPVNPPPPPPPADGTLNCILKGEAPTLMVTSNGKKVECGQLPPGNYEVRYTFGTSSGVKRVTVESGKTVTVKCDGSFKLCN